MALYLKVSNSLKHLAVDLADELKNAPNSVFEPHLLVTQTEGMNNWLKLQIASHLGITANCRFLKPNDLIHKLYYLLGGPYTEVLSAENLNWLLFRLLGEKDFKARFPSPAAYFSDSGPDKDIKRMALAEKLSDLFDQYQIYRPDMIRQWNIAMPNEVEKDAWQQYLWIKARQVSENTLPDKTTIGAFILDAIQHEDKQSILADKIPVIHLFGLSITTSYHLEILFKLSSLIDVYFHIINPAPNMYWFEDRSEKQIAIWRQKGPSHFAEAITGNILLTGWGKVIQETFSMFFQYDEFLNAYEDVGIVTPLPDSLLHKIQHDIFSAATDERNIIIDKDINDGSITINACFTIAREVEVLYNYLVHLADKKNEALSPRDIVVMVSDIDAYAPYIKAVFNNAPHKFRYTIADEGFADSDNIFEALHSALLMNEDNFSAESVMQLLDSSFIRKRFGINDVTRIRSIVNAANIRFGMEGNRNDETHFVSWRYGLRRIMFGICMSGEEEYDEGADSFFPLDLLEGSSAQELVRFTHFVEMLMDTIDKRKGERSLSDWVKYIELVLHNIVYEQDDDVDENYTSVMEQLAEYNIVNKYMSDKLPFEVFSHSFLKSLSGTSRSGLFANGGITFCSLIPMRSIPFKVVALLGLGYDKFPRREKPASFNLMEKKRQRGDRNVKENDKHLFLETIMSAQQYLYISYVGRSAKDNTNLPPSAVVDELLDYIEAGVDPLGLKEANEVRQQMVTLHPLQGFNSRYNDSDTKLYSYLNSVSIPVNNIIKENKVLDHVNHEEILIDDLLRFFRNPFKAYYNKVLGIFYDDEEILLQDTEIFSIDKLQEWSIKNRLLPLDEEARLQLNRQLVRTGSLPLSNMAHITMQQTELLVSPVRDLFIKATNGKTGQSVQVELKFENHLLKGALNNIYDKKLVQVSWSKSESKYLIEAYIRYLAGVAAGSLTGLYFISASKNDVYEGKPITREEALIRLEELITIYIQGLQKIAVFYPDFEIRPGDVEALDFNSFSKLIKKKLDDFKYPCNDPYIMNEYRKGFFSQHGISETYKFICQKVITPLEDLFPEYF
jgi:exodeoxyribonuclease V gamma subunit